MSAEQEYQDNATVLSVIWMTTLMWFPLAISLVLIKDLSLAMTKTDLQHSTGHLTAAITFLLHPPSLCGDPQPPAFPWNLALNVVIPCSTNMPWPWKWPYPQHHLSPGCHLCYQPTTTPHPIPLLTPHQHQSMLHHKQVQMTPELTQRKELAFVGSFQR